MTWGEGAVQPLAETFDGAFGSPGVVTAAACTDETGTTVAVNPGDTPADGRFETGSVTKTMTAALLALRSRSMRTAAENPPVPPPWTRVPSSRTCQPRPGACRSRAGPGVPAPR